MPSIERARAEEKMEGKLVVEAFRDYRSLENKEPRWDNCYDATWKTTFQSVDKVECKHEMIGAYKMPGDLTKDELLTTGIPRAITEDLEKRQLFDSVEFVKEAKDEYPDAAWRLVGLIVKVDETYIYNGYYLPFVNSYLFTLGAPRGRVADEIELELKFEDLKNKKIIVQKRFHRNEVSQGFQEYEFNTGYHGWDIGAYQFNKTLRLLIEDFLKDLSKTR